VKGAFAKEFSLGGHCERCFRKGALPKELSQGVPVKGAFAGRGAVEL